MCVTVETCQAVVDKRRAFLSEESAVPAEKIWLEETHIRQDAGRRAKSDGATQLLALGDAILDSLTRNAYKITLKGHSLRKKHKKTDG